MTNNLDDYRKLLDAHQAQCERIAAAKDVSPEHKEVAERSLKLIRELRPRLEHAQKAVSSGKPR
jgi:hypothetical protein